MEKMWREAERNESKAVFCFCERCEQSGACVSMCVCVCVWWVCVSVCTKRSALNGKLYVLIVCVCVCVYCVFLIFLFFYFF